MLYNCILCPLCHVLYIGKSTINCTLRWWNLFYGSGIWGTRSHNVINNVQTKAAKYFLAVGKRTSNASVHGDLGLTTCLKKQKLSCIRLKCKLVKTDDDRLTSKVAHWTSRRRKGWHFQVDKFISEIDASDVVTNLLISVKTATRIIGIFSYHSLSDMKMTEKDCRHVKRMTEKDCLFKC